LVESMISRTKSGVSLRGEHEKTKMMPIRRREHENGSLRAPICRVGRIQASKDEKLCFARTRAPFHESGAHTVARASF
jgi:hypothetical protein